ncbi:MAG: PKD domain-containing protein, partial [Saprospiraceae bacterium]
MKKSLLRNTILFLLFTFGGMQSAFATHIIGGEMNYQCLGNNEYQISLTVYRDCYLGEAPLDDTAYVAIFDRTGKLIETLPILLGSIDSIQQVDACLLIPPNICVETTTYIDTINLLPQTGGYHLAYQRCCRNETILNIIDPLNTGATYDVLLTEAAMLSCNNSPIKKIEPPTFVCVNRPLVWDNSAIDMEGDSLVYRLCTPLDGGISIDNPRPRPALPPPYDTVVWNAPTYDLNNILGGTALRIDRQTGLLTGTPNTIGQFVVGICIDEYRNGQFLSTTRRDFQYNVIPCEDIVAQFELPAEQCEDLSISPINQTQGEPDGFLWKFLNKKSQVIGTSIEKKPSYTFPDTGNYIVRLIINPNSICTDSTEQNIYFQANTLIPDFQYDIIGCADSLVLQFTDKSNNNLGLVNEWQWTINGTIDQLVSTEQNPKITLFNSQKLNVKLQVSTENGCKSEKEIELNAMIIPDSFSVSVFDTLILCKGDSIALNPVFNPTLTYSWSPPDGLNNSSAPNPLAFPDTSIAYVVMIRDSGNNCELRKNVFLEVIEFDNSFDYTIDTLECSDSVRIQLTPNPAYDLASVDLLWEVENNGTRMTFTNEQPIFIINNADNFKITGSVFDDFGCSKTVINNLQFDFIQTSIIPSFSLCRGDSIAINPNFNPNHSYLWSPAALFQDPSAPNPIISPRNNTTITVSISSPEANCPVQRTIDINVLNSIETADFQFQFNGCIDSAVLEITDIIIPAEGIIEETSWSLDGNQTTISSSDSLPTFVLKNSQSVQLSLTLNGNSACPITVSKTIQINLLEDLALPKRLDICRGESIALNPAEEFPNYIYNWRPIVDMSSPSAINPIVTPNQSTIFQLSYTDSTGLCTINRNIPLKVRDTLPPISGNFTVACNARTVQITPNDPATAIAYDFGDGAKTIDSVENITHTYTTTGLYEVQLSYVDEFVCKDSTTLQIDLPQDNLVPDFEWNVESCENNVAALELIDLSKTSYGRITNWDWLVSNGETATEREPLFQIATNEMLSAMLVVTIDNDETCQDSIRMDIPPLLIAEAFRDSIIACLG